jgi:hypothetical protein
MTTEGAHTAILTSALVVGATYAIRKLIEPAATEAHEGPKSIVDSMLQVSGAEPAPAAAGQFATAFGFTFVTLSIIATFAPSLAGSMATLVAVSNMLINGSSVFADITHQVNGGESELKKPPAAKAKAAP